MRKLSERVVSNDGQAAEMAIMGCVIFATVEHFLGAGDKVHELLDWTWTLVKKHPRNQDQALLTDFTHGGDFSHTHSSCGSTSAELSKLSDQLKLVEHFKQCVRV